MIYNITPTSLDYKLIDNISITKDITKVDYNNTIVKKPWGYEYLIFENENVAIWMLHISRTQKTSKHAHIGKLTSLILLSGEIAEISSINNTFLLNDFDCVIIDKSTFHSTNAISNISSIKPFSENGLLLIEIEAPVNKSDLIRLDDEYGRVGFGYETMKHIVTKPIEYFKLHYPNNGYEFQEFTFLNYKFIMIKSSKNLLKFVGDGYVILIENHNKNNNYLGVAIEITEAKEIFTSDLIYANSYFLFLTRENTIMKISDYIFGFIEKKGIKDIFAISGGGAMHLIDSIGKNNNLNYISSHHEQASSMAAEGYARIKGLPGICVVTSGPGGTNTITGVIGAWIDSIPMIVISGQVTSDTLSKNTDLRQFGIQECDITTFVEKYTKYSVTITDPKSIRYHLEKAYYLSMAGRPGPVWLDIPLDIQGKIIDINELLGYNEEVVEYKLDQIPEIIDLIENAKRPIIICGYGVRLSNSQQELLTFIETTHIPLISSWTTSDIINTDHNLYIGRSGIMGDRGSNFAVQNSDLLIIIGSRMSIPQVGYNYKLFAREAKKIMIDISENEMNKPSLNIDIKVVSDIKIFFEHFYKYIQENNINFEPKSNWITKCQEWKNKYPVCLPEYKNETDYVNSFYFISYLSEKLNTGAVVVTDMGTSFTCTMQTFKTKIGNRLFTSSGHASMGFGLPGAIGACIANNKKQTICITGEGGLQMNIQELQTVVTYNLPIILFVINNDGYLTIKSMQQNHFGRLVGSDPSSNVKFPNMQKIAISYDFNYIKISNHKELHNKLDNVLQLNEPTICEIIMHPFQQLIPRVSSMKLPDGRIVSRPIEDLFPFLDREEYENNMIVKPVEILSK